MSPYIRRNDKGEVITSHKKLSNPKFGTGEKTANGEEEVDWKQLSKYADEYGFDLRNKEDNGEYTVTIVLPKGTELIRYGAEYGKYTAPKGTAYEKLALPYAKETVEYHEYRVIADGLVVKCNVKKGIVAPGFGSEGGAVQYYHSMNMIMSVNNRVLERVR